MIQFNAESLPRRYRKIFVAGFVLAALLAASMMLAPKPAQAENLTFTVNSTGDPGSGGCNSTECTLAEAIAVANRVEGADTIRFNIPGEGVKTIKPATALPVITGPVTINGYSQPGSSPNTLANGTNANLLIELDLADAGAIEIEANNTVVRGLVLNNSRGSGVSVEAGTGNRIEGNFLGTDASGTLDRGNFAFGAQIDGGGNNTIGGTARFQRNLISGNEGKGIEISDNGSGGNTVRGNLIGTQKNGTSPLGNDGEGVYVDTPDNTIGGTGQGAANVIAFNARQGVFVEFVGVDNTGNRILGNSIFSNGLLGIDLRGGTENAAGATRNDPRDADTGANDLQNKPSLTSAVTAGGKTTVKGKLGSSPGDTFLIQLFSNASGDEGKTFIGSKIVSTNANGIAVFEFAASRAVPSGHGITATATDVGANTSEFSAPRTVVAR